MTIWLILVIAAVPISADNAQYECGAHGRFEYCIDDVPGCIIGCHCHPGYYFDTDTKICEPNTKLLQNYRRQYVLEPTRTPLTQMDYPEVIEQVTSLPTVGVLDDHVDTIAQNADDLGDWLYNQFYKAIESQVINKTNENVLTRRSGKGPEIKIIKNNRRRYERKNLNQRKQKKDSLRRKLLRITEDDSLFDSDTETDSSDTSSSKEPADSKDKEHGHKKFVIMNKKPKPPLPSFIFLPNMETQFYPPVGLPPPILPMYPMVPVPPVVPAFPFPHISPDCDQNQTITETSSTSLYTTSSIITTTSIKSVTTESTTSHITTASLTSINTEPTEENKKKILAYYRNRKRKNLGNNANDAIRRLRQLVQDSALKKQHKARTFPKDVTNRESIEINESLQVEPLSDEDYPQETNIKIKSIEEDKANFKYLSQLIHRIDLNDTKKSGIPRIKISSKNHQPFLTYNDKSSKTNSKISDPSRRFNIHSNIRSQKIKPSDSFYSKLGQQIAKLIREVDSKNDRQIDIEIEHMDQNTPNYPIFSDLSYAPHSYWERFARSPVTYLEQYRKKNNVLKKSNEVLYDIESKVKIAASTMSPMTLQEIENFINKMKKIEDKILKTNSKKYQFYNNTLNINLWPRDLKTIKALVNPTKSSAKKIQQQPNNTKKYTSENNLTFNSKANRRFDNWFTTEHSVNYIPRNIQNKQIYNVVNNEIKKVLSSNTEVTNAKFEQKIPDHANIPVDLKSTPISRANKQDLQTQPHSNFYNHNNHRFSVKYQYPFFNNILKFKFPTVEKSVNIPFLRTESPSYFQHEIRHFDYID